MRCCRRASRVEDEESVLMKMPPRPRTRQILASGAVRLLSAVWLIRQGDAYIIQRMQDLPEDAFMPPERAAALFDRYGGVVVVSYGWLSKNHPDPTGFHVRAVQKYLKKHYKGNFYWSDLPDYGVFWDFASLPQDNPDGTQKAAAEKRVFEVGLGAIGILYGDAKTLVIQLTRMPQELQLADGSVVNLTDYNSRGWCFFEATVSSMFTDSDQLLDLGAGVATLDDRDADWTAVQEASAAKRRPPLTPDDMAVELRKRRFTNGGDAELVAKKYREFFCEAAANADRLSLENSSAGKGWGDARVTQLARALPSFKRCKTLDLRYHDALGERGLAELRAALPRCPALQELRLPRHLLDTGEGQALVRAAARRVSVEWYT